MPSSSPVFVGAGTLGDGGIARYVRLVLGALDAPADLLDLSRGPALQCLPPGVRSCAVSRRPLHAGLVAARWMTASPRPWVFGHYALSLPLAALPRRHPATVLAHGMEVWTTLPPARAAGLRCIERMVFTTRHSRDVFTAANPALARRLDLPVVPLTAGPEWEVGPLARRPEDGLFELLCLTRLTASEQAKGVSTLLEALRALPRDVRLTVAGDGDGRPAYEAEARRLGVSEQVRWIGRVDETTKRARIAACDVLCLPSAQEGFGLVLLEALSVGRPCVGSAAGALPEVLSQDLAELARHGDPDALAAAIDRVRRRLQAGALTPDGLHAACVARYGWEAFRMRWRALLEGRPTS